MCDNLPEAVIKRAANGDSSAMSEIVEFYQKLVYNLAYSMLLNREDALDVSQEVFIKIYRFIPNFKFDCAFSTWIYTVTKNSVSDLCRSKNRHISAGIDEESVADDVASLSYRQSDIEEQAICDERKKLLYSAISMLSDNHREVIVLYHFCGISYEKISELLGIEKGTVKSRLNRAKNELRKILLDRNFF